MKSQFKVKYFDCQLDEHEIIADLIETYAGGTMDIYNTWDDIHTEIKLSQLISVESN